MNRLFKRLFLFVVIFLLSACAVLAMSERRSDYVEYFPEALKHASATDYFDSAAQIKLMRAVATDDKDKMQQALTAGANVNGVGRDGMTPLYWAMGKNSPAGTLWLVKNGADPNQSTEVPEEWNADDTTAMTLAVELTDPAYLRILLEHGGNPNIVVDDGGGTLIYYAIVPRHPENVRLLIRHGADINHKTKVGGTTPLMSAVLGNMFDIALLLLQSGADPTIPDNHGDTPVDVLGWYGNRAASTDSREAYPEFVDELKSRGLVPKGWSYDINAPIDYGNKLSEVKSKNWKNDVGQ